MENAMAMGRKWHNSGCHEPFTDPLPDGGVTDGQADPDGQTGSDGAEVQPDGQVDADGGAEADGATDPDPGSVTSGCSCDVAASKPGSTIFMILVLLALLVAIPNYRQ